MLHPDQANPLSEEKKHAYPHWQYPSPMSNDALDSMITAMRNAILRKAETVQVPATSTTINIGEILVEEGFLENLREHQEGTNHLLVLRGACHP